MIVICSLIMTVGVSLIVWLLSKCFYTDRYAIYSIAGIHSFAKFTRALNLTPAQCEQILEGWKDLLKEDCIDELDITLLKVIDIYLKANDDDGTC